MVEVEEPQGVAGDFVLYALGLSGVAFDGYAGAGRGEDIEAVGSADLMDAKEVSAIAYNDDAMEAVGAGYDGQSADGLIRAGALGLCDGVGFGNAGANEILLPDGTLRELIATLSTEDDDERGDASAIERFSVIEPGTKEGGGMSCVFRSSKDCNGIGGGSLILCGVMLNL